LVEAEEIWVEKYRPEKLSDIVGQDEVVSRLQSFVDKKSLPHLLFAGPAGTGKTSAALCIARELFGVGWRQNLLELNASVAPETPILVRTRGEVKRTNFGELAKVFFNSENQKYAYPEGIEILSLDDGYNVRFMPVSVISRHRVNQIAKVKYEGGVVRTSLDHSVVVIDDGGNLASKSVANLAWGDLLLTFVTELPGEEKVLDFGIHRPAQFVDLRSGRIENPKVKTILNDRELDDNLAWLLGMYLAEGCAVLDKDGTSGVTIFTLGSQETNEIQRLQDTLEGAMGLKTQLLPAPSGFDRTRMSALQLRTCNTQLAKFFMHNFYDGAAVRDATTKRVPSFVSSSPVRRRLEFLKGYMGDATGEWNNYVRYSSRSQECLIDIAWLGRISGLNTSCYQGEARLVWRLPSYSYLKTELLPARPFIKLFEKFDIPLHRYFMRHSLYYKRSKRISKHALKEFIRKNGLEHKSEFAHLLKLINSPVSTVLVRTVEISSYDGYVYDVSVPGAEVFWGGTTPILLHNSDERGIDTIRTKVKDYARTRPIGDVPYKLILLDESDALTRDAQHALRRTMEMYTHTARFILDCNYSSRIIEPIQSRCTVFRFKRLAEQDIAAALKRIARAEKLTLVDEAVKAIIYVSEGDMRRAINVLQSAAALKKRIDEKAIYEISAAAKPEEVRGMLELALSGKFDDARAKLLDLLVGQGLAGEDVLQQVHREIFNLNLPEPVKVKLIDKVGEADFRLTEGANERIQLEAVLAHFALIGDRLKE